MLSGDILLHSQAQLQNSQHCLTDEQVLNVNFLTLDINEYPLSLVPSSFNLLHMGGGGRFCPPNF